jgi:hypothetical protein
MNLEPHEFIEKEHEIIREEEKKKEEREKKIYEEFWRRFTLGEEKYKKEKEEEEAAKFRPQDFLEMEKARVGKDTGGKDAEKEVTNKTKTKIASSREKKKSKFNTKGHAQPN